MADPIREALDKLKADEPKPISQEAAREFAESQFELRPATMGDILTVARRVKALEDLVEELVESILVASRKAKDEAERETDG